jgi:hypothetical protein
MTTHHTNLRLRGNGQEWKVGKIVSYGGEPLFHVWADSAWMRHDDGAWGLNRAVVQHCRSVGVRRFAIYDKTSDSTYITDLDTLRNYGKLTAPRRERVWGSNVSLPLRLWQRQHGRLPLAYVADHIYEIVPVESVPDEPAQLDLFAGVAS